MRREHTYAICAYKESKYLEECIVSLKKQSMASHILLATSTPNEMIRGLAEKYDIPLYINEGEGGITQDWNYALSHVKTRYATIAHQDDVYEPEYTKKILGQMRASKKPLIAFCDYYELRGAKKVYDTTMLKIKRLMLAPMRIKAFKGSRFVRRRILSVGDPVCCPAVTFCMDELEQPIFTHGFLSCEDWEAWERISRMKGDFLYIPKPLMCHRIHEESATTAVLKDDARVKENYIMYRKFWPAPIAKMINHFYTKSEKSNELGKDERDAKQ